MKAWLPIDIFFAVVITFRLFANETSLNAETQSLATEIREKVKAGQRRELDFARELKEFDRILAENRDRKDNAIAKIALLKAALYIEIFKDIPKGQQIIDDIRETYPGTQSAMDAKILANRTIQQINAVKIRAALQNGALFPEFDVTALDGRSLSLTSLQGKIVLIHFWAGWCGPCLREMPTLQLIYKKYQSERYAMVGVSLDTKVETCKRYLTKYCIEWPQYFDGLKWNNILALQYGVDRVPSNYLLNDGKIIGHNLTPEQLDFALSQLLIATKHQN
jgi:thiol-disulfide isomerase/thioredoxin